MTGKDSEAGDIAVYRRCSRTPTSRKTSRSKPDRVLRQAQGWGGRLGGSEGLRLVGLPAGHFEELRFQTATFGKPARCYAHIQNTAQNRDNNSILIDTVGR